MPHSSRGRERLALTTYVKLMRAANAARTMASTQLAESGLTLTQFAVLEALYHLGPMSLSDLAQKILTTGGNLTMVVGNLEKQGLARRQRSPQDHRVQIVVLSAKGKQMIRGLFPQHAAAIADFLGLLSAEEQEHLGELCRKLGKVGASRQAGEPARAKLRPASA
jgi:MarR family 2-MHQ and catechol resistance regulon transcriptional repressor